MQEVSRYVVVFGLMVDSRVGGSVTKLVSIFDDPSWYGLLGARLGIFPANLNTLSQTLVMTELCERKRNRHEDFI